MMSASPQPETEPITRYVDPVLKERIAWALEQSLAAKDPEVREIYDALYWRLHEQSIRQYQAQRRQPLPPALPDRATWGRWATERGIGKAATDEQ